MKRIYLHIFFALLAYTINAQSKKAFIQAADLAFENKNYYSALTFYNEALQFDEKDPYLMYKSAESARMFNSYELAAQKYSYLIDTLGYNKDSLIYFHAGEMYHRLGNFDKANEFYDLYLSQYGKDGDPYTEKARKNKSAVVWASSRIKEPDPNVSITQVEGVNTDASDFGAFKDGDNLLFSSQRFLEQKPIVKPARKISKILSYKDDGVNEVETEFNKRDKNVANHAFNTDRSRIYYTVCDYVNDEQLRCDIFWSKVNADGTYSDEQILPEPINIPGTTSTQPSFAIDPKTGTEVMYFVSDRKGGKGKLDIWMAYFDKKLGFSNPINLLDINTEENEITPFFHNKTKTLYFSTDGRNGFGGYDIFSSFYSDEKYGLPEVLPVPYNTTYHDLYYKLNEEGNEAYFSSNREGTNYVDVNLKSCCYDIFKADIKPLEINLNALTFDKASGLDLKGATVKLYDKSTGKLIGEVKSDNNNEHKFVLEKGKEYLVVAEKEGYKSDSVVVNTSSIRSSQDIIEKLYLETDKITLDVFTFDEATRNALNGAKVTIEDLTDPNNPVLVQVNELGNNFTFALDKNKTYRITASKPGYGTVSEIIDTRGVVGKITKNLYLPKADINRLLPLALYFDNDEPEQDSKSTETNKRYGDLVRDYMLRKPVFMEKYGKGIKEPEKSASIQRMEEFFEGDVRGGYDRFSFFMDELIKALSQGQKIEMTIRGYASPRFDERYNLVLGQRRINSVRNDMMQYKGGALAPYLLNKQLIITEISYGEELSPVDVIDNINDERGSIYSLKASKERKVEVISVKVK